MVNPELIDPIVERVKSEFHRYKIFKDGVVSVFTEDPIIKGPPPVVHSIKARMKNESHLRDKIIRKYSTEDPISQENVFDRVTDIAGVRILHLYQDQFTKIHECIQKQIDYGDWVLYETPKAYTWDPEFQDFFTRQGLEVEVKESFYTSIHYIVKPRKDSFITCEVQVRTLFEEIWGEIDHAINYPHPTDILSCREQLRVLARLVGAGSRLADSIFRTFNDRMLKEK